MVESHSRENDAARRVARERDAGGGAKRARDDNNLFVILAPASRKFAKSLDLYHPRNLPD
jgi:hypothetical protein